jgi:hypothetical protein
MPRHCSNRLIAKNFPITTGKRFAVTVGSVGCLRAVGVECGLMGGECEPNPVLVGAECEPKIPLVCEPTAYCLQAVTDTQRS